MEEFGPSPKYPLGAAGLGHFCNSFRRSKYFCKMERENKLEIIIDDTKHLKNIQAEQIPAKQYRFIEFLIHLTNTSLQSGK